MWTPFVILVRASPFLGRERAVGSLLSFFWRTSHLGFDANFKFQKYNYSVSLFYNRLYKCDYVFFTCILPGYSANYKLILIILFVREWCRSGPTIIETDLELEIIINKNKFIALFCLMCIFAVVKISGVLCQWSRPHHFVTKIIFNVKNWQIYFWLHLKNTYWSNS